MTNSSPPREGISGGPHSDGDREFATISKLLSTRILLGLFVPILIAAVTEVGAEIGRELEWISHASEDILDLSTAFLCLVAPLVFFYGLPIYPKFKWTLTLALVCVLLAQFIDSTDEISVLQGFPIFGKDSRLNDPTTLSLRFLAAILGVLSIYFLVMESLRTQRTLGKEMQAIQTAEQRFRGIFEHSMIGMYRTTPAGKILLANQALVEMTGVPSFEELQTRDLSQEGFPTLKRRREFVETIERDGEVIGWEDIWTRSDGTELFVRESARCVRDENGKTLYYEGTVEDVSDRKKLEEAYRQLVDQSAQGLTLIQEGRYVFVNRAICEMHGYTESEMLAMTPEEIRDSIHPDDREIVWERHRRRLSGETLLPSYEIRVLRKDGNPVWIELHPVRIDYMGKPAIQTAVIDVSKRKEAEQALVESRQVTDAVFENAADTLFLVEKEGLTIVDCNSAAIELFELETKQDLIGRRGLEFRKHPLSKDELRRIRETLDAGATWRDEVEYLTQSGREIWGSLVVNQIAPTGKPYLIVRITDITEKKRDEEERRNLEAQVQHAQKLESLGILAGGIAHDFNNLLMGILGNAGLGLMDLPTSSPVRDYLTEIETASQRAADLCKQLLAYSGRGKFEVKVLSLSTLVREMGRLLEVSISKKASLHYELEDDLPSIEGDATQIRQVIMNLMTNASESLGDKEGTISIRTGERHCKREVWSKTFAGDELREGEYVYVEVSDSGCGMNDETVARIFDPFFTTKFSGRGLGMAAVLGIVRGHHGAIEVKTSPGQGTTFLVYFPSCRERATSAGTLDVPAGRPSFRGKVLVADDEEPVRNIARTMLKRMGLEVETVEDGEACLDLFSKSAEGWRLIVLDLTMPKMGGLEVLKQISARSPDTPVLLSSGFNEVEVGSILAGNDRVAFLQKPYSPQQLAQKVSQLLGGREFGPTL